MENDLNHRDFSLLESRKCDIDDRQKKRAIGFRLSRGVDQVIKFAGIVALFAVCTWGLMESGQAKEMPISGETSLLKNTLVVFAGLTGHAAPVTGKAAGGNTPIAGRITVKSSQFKQSPKFEHILKNSPKGHGLAPQKSQEAYVNGR